MRHQEAIPASPSSERYPSATRFVTEVLFKLVDKVGERLSAIADNVCQEPAGYINDGPPADYTTELQYSHDGTITISCTSKCWFPVRQINLPFAFTLSATNACVLNCEGAALPDQMESAGLVEPDLGSRLFPEETALPPSG